MVTVMAYTDNDDKKAQNISSYVTIHKILGVRDCPAVLETFIARQKDPEYVKFIRQSNANCNYASQAICCPREAPNSGGTPNSGETQPIQPVEIRTSKARLLTPSEGCGVSKVPHNRVVGGVPAKKGNVASKFNESVE